MTNDQHRINFDSADTISPIEREVLFLIRPGRDNAISMSALAEAVGISTRELQQIIQRLINGRGVAIASATGRNHGYYLPETAEEYKAATDQLKHRIIALAHRIRSLDRAAYEEIFGQGNIFQEVQ